MWLAPTRRRSTLRSRTKYVHKFERPNSPCFSPRAPPLRHALWDPLPPLHSFSSAKTSFLRSLFRFFLKNHQLKFLRIFCIFLPLNFSSMRENNSFTLFECVPHFRDGRMPSLGQLLIKRTLHSYCDVFLLNSRYVVFFSENEKKSSGSESFKKTLFF